MDRGRKQSFASRIFPDAESDRSSVNRAEGDEPMTHAKASKHALGARSRRLVRNVLHLGVGQVISTCLGFLLTAALGRALEPSDFGLLYLVGTIYGLVAILIDWGQSTYVVRDSARGRADDPHYVGAVLWVRALCNVCGTAIGVLIALALGYDGNTALLVALAVVAGFPVSLAAALGLLFRGRDRMDLDVLVALVAKALAVAATLLTLAFTKSLVALVLVPVIGGVGALVLAAVLRRRLGIGIERPNGGAALAIFRGGAPMVVLGLCMGMQPFVDVAILSLLTGPAVIAWLGASRTLLGIFMAPAAILAGASFPDLARAASSPPDLRRIATASARLVLAAGVSAAAILLVFANLGVAITYGTGKFDQAALLLQVTAPVLPLLFLNFVLGNTVFAVGHGAGVAGAKVFCMSVGAIICWFVIPYCQSRYNNGAIGVILSYNLMEGAMFALLLYLQPKGALDRQILLHLVRAYVVFGAVLLAFLTLPSLSVWLALPLYGAIVVAGLLLTRLILLSDIVKVLAVVRPWLRTARGHANALASRFGYTGGPQQ